MKVNKLFDVRWVRALLRDYPALFALFNECSASHEKTSEEKSKLQSSLLLAEYAKRCIALFVAVVIVSTE